MTITNGSERQHEHLKYSYLSNMSNGSLADIISVLTDTYVPHCHKRYSVGRLSELYDSEPSVPTRIHQSRMKTNGCHSIRHGWLHSKRHRFPSWWQPQRLGKAAWTPQVQLLVQHVKRLAGRHHIFSHWHLCSTLSQKVLGNECMLSGQDSAIFGGHILVPPQQADEVYKTLSGTHATRYNTYFWTWYHTAGSRKFQSRLRHAVMWIHWLE